MIFIVLVNVTQVTETLITRYAKSDVPREKSVSITSIRPFSTINDSTTHFYRPASSLVFYIKISTQNSPDLIRDD